MRTSIAIAVVMIIATSAVVHDQTAQRPSAAAGQAEPAPPAPAPGSAGIFKSNADLQQVLKKAIAGTNDMATSAVANTDQYRVNIVHRPKPNGAIAHPGNTELHYIIDGSGTVVTGGHIIRNPGAPASSATIKGGERHKVTKGDIIIVPAGSAHMYSQVDGEITYLEVRFVAPK